jgi:hypothetical protein
MVCAHSISASTTQEPYGVLHALLPMLPPNLHP